MLGYYHPKESIQHSVNVESLKSRLPWNFFTGICISDQNTC